MPNPDTLLPEVESFLATDPVRMFIDGQWTTAADGDTFTTIDPGDAKPLATVAQAKPADVDRAVKAANNAFHKTQWATMPANDRAVILHRLADLVDKHKLVLSQLEALDVGKPWPIAEAVDITNVAQTIRWYADFSAHARLREPIALSGYEASQIRKPYGAVAFILPWNFPMLLVGWNIAPALAAGNTIIIKPAEDTPLTTLYFCKLVEEAGIPAGVVNVVTGYGHLAGKSLAEHPGIKRMGFTGSPEVGREIAAACGRNLVPTKLELGGKGAAVVFDDVDIKATARALVDAVTFNTGQVCCTATRWMVHEIIYDEFVDRAKAMMASIRIGHGLDPMTQMGPVVSEKQRLRILGYLGKGITQGADPILPGGVQIVENYEQGFYVKPALLAGDPGNICATDEIFGPVAYLMKYADEQQAVELVNRSDYGLANSVWSKDPTRCQRVAEALIAGSSWINGHNLFPHGVPYGGCNRSGCGGGVLGPDTFFDYLRPQSIVRPVSS